MAFQLADLFVTIKAQDDALQRQVGEVRGQLTGMGVALGTAAGNLLTSAISGAVSAISGFFTKGVAGATNLGESLAKVGTVFGESASVLTGTADELATRFGLSKQDILDAGSNIGLVGKAAGQSQAQAAAMGAQMARLAADASSFYNVPLDQALEKIRSGLVGESEPMRAFGVLLNEEAVANEAVALGLAKSTKEVDQQAKVMARASLITKGLADATGDLDRTSDSTANQWRKFTGSLENMAVSIGTALLPAANALINVASEMVTALASGFNESNAAFQSFVAGVTEAANVVGIVWRNLPDIWEIVRLSAIQMAQNVVAAIATIPENLAIIGKWIGENWVKMIADAVNAVMTIFTNLGTNIGALGNAIAAFLSDPTKGFKVDFKPLLEGFTATTAALPELVKPQLNQLQGEIDAVAGRIADRESARALAIADKGKEAIKPAVKDVEKAAGKEKDFKSQSYDIADFSSKLRESIFSAKDDTAKKHLAASERTAVATEETRDALKKGIPAVLS